VGSEAETQPVEDLQELSLSTSIDFDEQLCSLFDENIMVLILNVCRPFYVSIY
jgi:hypothetical protein